MRIWRSILSHGIRTLGVALLVGTPALLAAERAHAAVITVNTFDQVNGPLCTLSDAILSANANGNVGGCAGVGAYGADTIQLPHGTYPLTQPHSGADGLPPITDTLTIEGNGSTIARTLGDAPPFFRIVHHTGGRLVLSNLTITGGYIRTAGFARGGGIMSELPVPSSPNVDGRAELLPGLDPDLSLIDVIVVLNIVELIVEGSAEGGGLYAKNGEVYLKRASIERNEARAPLPAGSVSTPAPAGLPSAGQVCGGGAAFASAPRVDVVQTRIVDNRAVKAGNFGAALGGGACHSNGDFGRILYLGSTVVANRADAGTGFADPDAVAGFAAGGGFAVFGHVPLFEMQYTDVSGNTSTASAGPGRPGQATGGGGAFFFAAACGGLSVTGSTIAGNSAIADGDKGAEGSIIASGGGLWAQLPDFIGLDVSDSSVTGNLARSTAPTGTATGGGIDVSAAIVGPDSAPFTVTSTTFADNRVEAPGAGGFAAGGGARMGRRGDFYLGNATVMGNSASGAGTSAGGGVYAQSNSVFKPINSVLSGNTVATAQTTSGPDCSRSSNATVSSLGHNLVGVASPCAFVASDLIGVPPGLGPLTSGPRVASGHLPPLALSPVLDAADPAACPARDQLGQKRAGPCDIGAVERVPQTSIVFSGLPNGRAGQPGDVLSVFATAINAGSAEAYLVGIDSLLPFGPGGVAGGGLLLAFGTDFTFTYQTTDSTNQLTGTPNTPVDVPPGGVQSYIVFIRPREVFDPVDLAIGMDGPNATPVPPIRGVSTVLVSSADPRPADVVALAATVGNNGIMDLSPVPTLALAPSTPAATASSGFFSVATINLGAGGPITASVDTGGVSLPIDLFLCQTNPATGVCTSPLQASLTVTIGTNETPTFAVFGSASAPIALDPATRRAFVSFKDAGGAVRGGTSVAIRTVP